MQAWLEKLEERVTKNLKPQLRLVEVEIPSMEEITFERLRELQKENSRTAILFREKIESAPRRNFL